MKVSKSYKIVYPSFMISGKLYNWLLFGYLINVFLVVLTFDFVIPLDIVAFPFAVVTIILLPYFCPHVVFTSDVVTLHIVAFASVWSMS